MYKIFENAGYTVEHYQQDLVGNTYTLAETEDLTGQTDSTATAAVKDYTGFSENTSHTDGVPSGTITADGSLVLKLFYDRETYTVGFESNGGSSVNDKTGVRYGAKISEPSISREGYTFAGWHADSGLTEAWSFSSDTVTAATTLYAKWSVDEHTLTFHPNGGIGTMNPIVLDTAQVTTLPSNSFTKDGYHFIGWTDSSSGSVVFADEANYTMGTTDAVLYAKWAPNGDTPYSVEHWQQNVSDDTYSLAETEDLTGQTDSTATAAVKGYTGFSENTSHADRVPSGTITADGSLVLKLFYDRDTYTVSFNSNGGSSINAIFDVRYQSTISEPSAPTKNGYTFAGWYENMHDPVAWNFSTAAITEETSLNAKWSPKAFILTFEPNGGQGVMDSLELETYESITLPANVYTRKGYSFRGWATNVLGSSNYLDQDTYHMIMGDDILYAQWERNLDTAYTVEHWRQDVSGSGYTKYETENLNGTTETTATASVKSYTGFSENTSHEDRVPNGTIAGDGSLILKLFYDRNTYTVSYISNGGSSVSDITGVRYGATVSEPTIIRAGYTLGGWFADSILTDAWNFTDEAVTGDTVLYAQWIPNGDTPYTVEHYQQNVSDNTYTLAETENLSGTTNTTVTAEVKSYQGFSENTSHAERVNSGTVAGDGSLVLKLFYDRKTYTVRFESYGGSSVSSITGIRYNATINKPDNPTSPGFTFVAWFENENLMEGPAWDFSTQHVIQDMTLYARWSADEHVLSFDANGGSGTMTSQLLTTEKTITLPTNTFYLTGYNFIGWGTSSTGPINYSDRASFQMGISDETLYALWSPNTNTTYRVEHWRQDVSGSGYTKYETENLNGTTETTATASVKSYTGFSENTSHEDRVPNGTIAGDGSLVLKLFYDRNTYTVSYISNGGSSVSDITGVRYGATVSEPTIIRAGYTLGGWFADSILTDAWNFTDKAVTGDTVLYAQWIPNGDTPYTVEHYQQNVSDNTYTLAETEKLSGTTNTTVTAEVKSYQGFSENTSHAERVNSGTVAGDGLLVLKLFYDRKTYTVRFESYGGSSVNSITDVKYEFSINEPTTPTKTGYTFIGWYMDSNLNEIWHFDSDIVTTTMTLYAKWLGDEHTLSFAANGGDGIMESVTFRTGDSVDLPLNIFTREGYRFLEWYCPMSGAYYTDGASLVNMGNSDYTFSALWTELRVGDIGPADGYIFYDDEADGVDDIDGYRYLEAAPYGWYAGGDDPVFQWGAFGYQVTPSAKSQLLGSGVLNTQNIVFFHDNLKNQYPDYGDYYVNPEAYYDDGWLINDGSVAAKICADAEINGFSDWFLPSKNSLSLMYNTLFNHDLKNFSRSQYWCSSEETIAEAWSMDFNGGMFYMHHKVDSEAVRPIRAF